MTGKTFTDYTFKKKDTVRTMKARSTIQTDDDIIPVDPLLLSEHLITTVRGLGSDLDLETAFMYELCTFPPVLVDTDGLSRGAKGKHSMRFSIFMWIMLSRIREKVQQLYLTAMMAIPLQKISLIFVGPREFSCQP